MSDFESLTSLTHCERAVDYGQRGLKCSNARKCQSQLNDLITQAQRYKKFESKKFEISRLLRGEVHIHEAQTAKNTYLQARDGNDPLIELLDKWWQAELERAIRQLRQQSAKLPEHSSPFTRLEPWICIVILTGQWSGQTQDEIDRLIRLAGALTRQVQAEVADSAAALHSEYATIDPKRDVLAKQIEFCEQLRQDLVAPLSALQFCHEAISERAVASNSVLEKLATRLKSNSEALGNSVSELDRWMEGKLKPFQSELGQTIDLIRNALRRGSFELVDNVFTRATASPTAPQPPGLPEPGTAFQGFTAHLSYLWLREYVEEQKGRLQKQKEHKQYIDWGFKLEVESAVHPADLDKRVEQWQQDNKTASTPVQTQFDGFVSDLRVSLAHGHYPLERIFHRLEEMRTQEDKDECRLQAQLVYQDPETRMRYEGLTQIAPIIQKKTRQIEQIRNWLAEHGIPEQGATIQHRCPGIADWDSAEKSIKADRKIGKFSRASQRCYDLREGLDNPQSDNRFTAEGLWPLERARRELGRLPTEIGNPTSAVIRALDAKRIQRLAELERQIEECRNLEKDLATRKKRQETAQKEIEELYADLSSAQNSLPFGRDKRVRIVIDEIQIAIAKYREQVCDEDDYITKAQRDLGL